jgi:site-specific recombinase XerD
MLDRVFSHLGVTPNPARSATIQLYHGRQLGKDSPKEFLDSAEQALFWAALPACAPWVPNESPKEWKKRRDRAMFALMLGAGLTVSEVICLYRVNIGQQAPDGSVPVTVWAPNVDGAPAREGTGFTHVTLLRPFAVKEVMNWLAERDEKYPAGSGRAFPAGISEEQVDQLVDKSTLYRHVKATLSAAGVDAERQGGRTLRNTFAREEFTRGTPIDTLREYLGLSKRDSIDPYLQGLL